MLLQHQHTKIEGDGIEPSRKDNARTRCLCGFIMLVDFLAHPCGLSAQIGIVGAIGNAGFDQFIAIQLIRSNGGQHHFGALHHSIQRCGVRRVRHD